jgi:catechol 2,3-dioxygenase-like lactoylglutathione lyase family enzyme
VSVKYGKSHPKTTVLPCSDYGRARAWYEEKLGMKPTSEEMGNGWYQCAGGTWLILTSSQYAGTAQTLLPASR